MKTKPTLIYNIRIKIGDDNDLFEGLPPGAGLHEALCKCIYEADEVAQNWLDYNVIDIEISEDEPSHGVVETE